MPGILIRDFHGLYPRLDRRLPDHPYAQDAHDVKLWHGRIEPWTTPQLVQTEAFDIETIYDIPECAGYLCWDQLTDVVDIQFENCPRRVYTTNGTGFKVAEALQACAGNYFSVGVPCPTSAPGVSAGIGGRPCSEGRGFVYTYVNAFGEEGPPSPVAWSASEVTGTVTVTAPAGAVGDKVPIVATRFYSAQSGFYSGSMASRDTAADSGFVFLGEIGSNGGGFTGPAQVEGPELTTVDFFEPPAGLTNIVLTQSGMMAGSVGNVVYFSENQAYYAWPQGKSLTVRDNVVALIENYGQLYILTEGKPYRVSFSRSDREGYIPDAIEYPHPLPCVSKRSAESSNAGCIYASNQGLVLLTPNSAPAVFTKPYFEYDDWCATLPETSKGVTHNGTYFYTTDVNTWMYEFDDSSHPSRPINPDVTTTSIQPDYWYVSRDNKLIYSIGEEKFEWDPCDGELMPYRYRTKLHVKRGLDNFAAIKIVKKTNDLTLANREPVHVRIFTDPYSRQEMAMVYEFDAFDSEPYRLPCSYRGISWEIEVTGLDPIYEIHIASSIQELIEVETQNAVRNTQSRVLG